VSLPDVPDGVAGEQRRIEFNATPDPAARPGSRRWRYRRHEAWCRFGLGLGPGWRAICPPSCSSDDRRLSRKLRACRRVAGGEALQPRAVRAHNGRESTTCKCSQRPVERHVLGASRRNGRSISASGDQPGRKSAAWSATVSQRLGSLVSDPSSTIRSAAAARVTNTSCCGWENAAWSSYAGCR